MAKPEAFIRMVTTEAHISKANMVSPLNWHKSDFEFCSLAIGTIHFRCLQISQFLTPTPIRWHFLLLSVGQIRQILHPYISKNADILIGWSHTFILQQGSSF